MVIKDLKSGISLITLVITIVVIIILTGAIVLSITSNNPIKQAGRAVFVSDLSNYQSALDMYIGTRYIDERGEFEVSSLDGRKLETVIDIAEKYKDKFGVEDGKIVIIGDITDEERGWIDGIIDDIKVPDNLTDEEVTEKVKTLYYDMDLLLDAAGGSNGITMNSVKEGIHNIDEWRDIFNKAKKAGKTIKGKTSISVMASKEKDNRDEMKAKTIWMVPRTTGYIMVKIAVNNSDQTSTGDVPVAMALDYELAINYDVNTCKLLNSYNYGFALNGPQYGDYEYLVMKIDQSVVDKQFIYMIARANKFPSYGLEEFGQTMSIEMEFISDKDLASIAG